MPATLLIDNETRSRARYPSAVSLLVNDNFFYYDGEYRVGIGLLSSAKELADYTPLPTLKWQLAQLRQIAALSAEDRRLIGDYVNWDSDRLNNELLTNPDQEAPLNVLISSLEKTDKEITVYRYIRAYEIRSATRKNLLYLPPDEGEYVYNSYLSTSFLLSYVLDQACENEVVALMIITIPMGSKVMSIPGSIGRQEYEILLPHKTTLTMKGKGEETYPCGKEDKTFLVYRATVVM